MLCVCVRSQCSEAVLDLTNAFCRFQIKLLRPGVVTVKHPLACHTYRVDVSNEDGTFTEQDPALAVEWDHWATTPQSGGSAMNAWSNEPPLGRKVLLLSSLIEGEEEYHET